MLHNIVLNGCAPAPLIHYLKALGIFRLVAEQCDPRVRGAWYGNAFMVETTHRMSLWLSCYVSTVRHRSLHRGTVAVAFIRRTRISERCLKRYVELPYRAWMITARRLPVLTLSLEI